MLPALALEGGLAEHLERYGCVGLDWQTTTFRAHAYLFTDGRLHDPVIWIGDTCWPITPDADRGESLGRPWSSRRRALPSGAA